MAREGQKATPSLIKNWKSQNNISEEHIAALLETKYPERFREKEKIVHQAILDIWHATDEGQLINEDYVLNYLVSQFKAGKLYKYDNFAEYESSKQLQFYNLILDAYCKVHYNKQPIYLSKIPEYTEEVKKVIEYYHPDKNDLCEYINQEFDNTTINFPRDYKHDDRLFVLAYVVDNDIVFDENNGSSPKDSNKGGCAILLIPIIITALAFALE